MTSIARTPEWNQREYDREKWPAVERLIEEEVQAGGGLSAVLARVARREYYGKQGALSQQEAIFGGRDIRIPQSVAFWGHQALIVESVVAACEHDTELVLELGSGWGRNLLLAWLTGGPRDARYVAGECTESGSRAALSLATLAPDLDFRALPFNFHDPDLASMCGFAHAVVFTAHGIGQIPRLRPEVLREISTVATRVTCIHLEPFGWQIAESQERAGSSERYAEANDYNRNLVKLVTDEQADGRLRIEEIQAEVVGLNPRHSTSILVWRSP